MPPAPARIAAVTFDAAGTLIAVAEPVGETYARIAARYGLTSDAGAIERRFRSAFAAAPPLAFPGADSHSLGERERGWWKAIVARAIGADPDTPGFEACFDALFAHYASPQAWRVYPDVVPALGSLRRAGLRLAVVSNFDRRLVDLLAGLGLGALLDAVVPSTAAGAAKPDTMIFRRALAALGVEADAALHVGGRMREDVEGARAAGLGAILLDRNRGHAPVPGGVRSIGTLAELPALLDHP